MCARHQVTIFATADEKLLGAECAHSLMTLVERELDLLAGLPADSERLQRFTKDALPTVRHREIGTEL